MTQIILLLIGLIAGLMLGYVLGVKKNGSRVKELSELAGTIAEKVNRLDDTETLEEKAERIKAETAKEEPMSEDYPLGGNIEPSDIEIEKEMDLREAQASKWGEGY